MRSKAVSRLALEGDFVVVFVLLILLPRDFATSNDVIDADGDDCQRHPTDAGDVAKTSSSNGARCGNASGQPEANNNAVLKEQHETRIRDRETWRFILLGRFWHFRHHQPPTDIVQVSSAHDDDGRSGDRRGFDALVQIETDRSDRMCSESTTYIYSSQCVGSRNFTGARNDDTSLRLYFKVEPLEAVHRLRETKVASAFLYMKKKSSPASASHRPAALTNVRTGRHRTDAGPSGSNGRGPHQRRRPNRDVGDFPSASLFSPSSPASPRSETTGAATSGLKIIVSSISRTNKKHRQEMRPVSVIPFPRQSSSEWIRISLTPLVDEWMKRPLKNLGLQVTIRSDAAASSSTADLNPDDYFEGINCSAATGNSSPIQLPQQWSLEEPVSQSIVNWTRIHLENITHPFLEVVTVEVPRSRPRHRREVKADSSSKRRIDGAEHDADHYKSMVLCKWLKLLKNSEHSSSRTRHQTPSTSNPVQPMASLRHGGQQSK